MRKNNSNIPHMFLIKALGALIIGAFICEVMQIENKLLAYAIVIGFFAITYDNKDVDNY